MPKIIPEEFLDTDPKTLRIWMDMQKKMSPAERVKLALDASEFMLEACRAGVKLQFPNASERELLLRTAARHLSRDLMIRAYGWDPDGNVQPA